MTSDVCLIWPAINAVREGYNVQVTTCEAFPLFAMFALCPRSHT